MNVKDVRTLPCKAGTTTKSTVEGMPATKLGNNETQLDRIMIDLRVYCKVGYYKPAIPAILAIHVIAVLLALPAIQVRGVILIQLVM